MANSIVLALLFGANTKNIPNTYIFGKAQKVCDTLSKCCLIRQTAQGEVTLTYEGREWKHTEPSEKTCLSSKEVIDVAIKLLGEAGIPTKKATWHVITHQMHTWPAMILRRKGFNRVHQWTGAVSFAGREEPQSRCRAEFKFSAYRLMVLLHHWLIKKWIYNPFFDIDDNREQAIINSARPD